MKLTLLFFILSSLTIATVSVSSILKEQYQWRDRVLYVFAPDHSSELYRQQLQVLLNNQEGLVERDIVFYSIFHLSGIDPGKNVLSEARVDSLRRTHQVNQDVFTVILIGKDGTEKMRSYKVVGAEELFAVVDAMPMRQIEIQSNKQAVNH